MCAAMTFRAFSGLARFDGADDVLVADPSDAIYSWGSFPLQRVKAIPKQPDRQMVEQCGELHLLPFPWSGRAMAQTGLRMMPTFPSSPLKFRKVGFPQYGFKAGVSDRAFPFGARSSHPSGLPLSFVLSAFIV